MCKLSSRYKNLLSQILVVTVSILGLLTSPLLSSAENVVLITLDGMRWQEVFRGIDYTLTNTEEYSEQRELILSKFWSDNAEERAELLMPFLHREIFKKGSYAGNRDAGSCAKVSNPWYFSYPGYSEILTGIVNPVIDSNNKVLNPEKTFLELLDSNSEFASKQAAFASWDVFPFIFNVQRSGLHVNAFGPAEQPLNEYELFLNGMIADMPPRWPTVRNDVFTQKYALSYLREKHPRVLYISYGETDDFAHEGLYDAYVLAANRTDKFIEEIWDEIQSSVVYRNNTVLFITVDHGRGEDPVETWQHHASKESVTGYMTSLAQYKDGIVGSEAVWMAAMGSNVPRNGLIRADTNNCLTSNRIASTLMQYLDEDYREYNAAMGPPMAEFLPK